MIEKWVSELSPLMPNAVTRQAYGTDAFDNDHQFSPWISDKGSFKAVRTVLETYGQQVRACIFRPMGDRAVQMCVVFEKEISGPACHLYRKQP
jgi:hypothetical protein